MHRQVKHASEGRGYGGDWAVRVSASLTPAGKAKQEAAKAAAEAEGRKPAKRKLSLVIYFADAHWRTSELEMWPDQQQSKLGEVRCCAALRIYAWQGRSSSNSSVQQVWLLQCIQCSCSATRWQRRQPRQHPSLAGRMCGAT
jgi:hypothetical protein